MKHPPARVVNAVNEYKIESDIVALWVDEANVVKNGTYGSKPAKIVYQTYVDWHNENESGRPVSATMFGKRMKVFGIGSEKISGKRVYVGIDLHEQDR